MANNPVRKTLHVTDDSSPLLYEYLRRNSVHGIRTLRDAVESLLRQHGEQGLKMLALGMDVCADKPALLVNAGRAQPQVAAVAQAPSDATQRSPAKPEEQAVVDSQGIVPAVQDAPPSSEVLVVAEEKPNQASSETAIPQQSAEMPGAVAENKAQVENAELKNEGNAPKSSGLTPERQAELKRLLKQNQF